MSALILDCDGVIADTERFGHLPAFNRTFEEFGLPMRWSEASYGGALAIGGGKERMAALLTPELIEAAGLPTDAEALRAAIARWHARKTAVYVELVEAGRVPARPGIGRIAAEARDAGWQLAVCSTSAERSVRAILEHAVGWELAAAFLVLAGDVVARKKPAPDIYLLALERLGIAPSDAVVVEDSANGLAAATAAALTTLVTVNDYTAEQDFASAALVVTTLGDPRGPRTEIVANRSAARPGAYVTLADLAALLPGGPAEGGE